MNPGGPTTCYRVGLVTIVSARAQPATPPPVATVLPGHPEPETPEQEQEFKSALEGSTILREALTKALQPKLNAIDKELSDVEALAKLPNAKDYMFSLLQARNIYRCILDLIQ